MGMSLAYFPMLRKRLFVPLSSRPFLSAPRSPGSKLTQRDRFRPEADIAVGAKINNFATRADYPKIAPLLRKVTPRLNSSKSPPEAGFEVLYWAHCRSLYPAGQGTFL